MSSFCEFFFSTEHNSMTFFDKIDSKIWGLYFKLFNSFFAGVISLNSLSVIAAYWRLDSSAENLNEFFFN
jgi:hypothetical protein